MVVRKTRVRVCVRGDLVNLLECADECEYWAVSDSSDSNFCVYRDDVAHTHSLARVVRLLKGRLDASTGWGLCIYSAADGEPETKPVVCKQGEQ